MKSNKKLLGAGLLTAIASSLCCITPVLALISGTSGVASSFSWMEPLRPYLIGFTVLVLGFAWYQKLKPKKELECNCAPDEKPSFLQSKLFLAIVTVFAVVMTLFPYYSSLFYGESKQNKEFVQQNTKEVEFNVQGMTCASCEQHINYTIEELPGVFFTHTSYENKNTIVVYDSLKVSEKEIEKAINSTGYKVKK